MKNINIFIFSLVLYVSCTLNTHGQIVQDKVYLDYEAAYIKYGNDVSPIIHELDVLSRDFNQKFDTKNYSKFLKSKDKEKWLTKNITKTNFLDINEALFMYNTLQEYQNFKLEKSTQLNVLYEALVSKYDKDVVFETLKERLLKE